MQDCARLVEVKINNNHYNMKTITQLSNEYIVENVITNLLKKLFNILFSNVNVMFNTMKDVFDKNVSTDDEKTRRDFDGAAEKMKNAKTGEDVVNTSNECVKALIGDNIEDYEENFDGNELKGSKKLNDKIAIVIMSIYALAISKLKEFGNNEKNNTYIEKFTARLKSLKEKYSAAFKSFCEFAKDTIKQEQDNKKDENNTQDNNTQNDIMKGISSVVAKIKYNGDIKDIYDNIKNTLKLNEGKATNLRQHMHERNIQQKKMSSDIKKIHDYYKNNNDDGKDVIHLLVLIKIASDVINDKTKVDLSGIYNIINMLEKVKPNKK